MALTNKSLPVIIIFIDTCHRTFQIFPRWIIIIQWIAEISCIRTKIHLFEFSYYIGHNKFHKGVITYKISFKVTFATLSSSMLDSSVFGSFLKQCARKINKARNEQTINIINGFFAFISVSFVYKILKKDDSLDHIISSLV